MKTGTIADLKKSEGRALAALTVLLNDRSRRGDRTINGFAVYHGETRNID
jgi:hypothetical protein